MAVVSSGAGQVWHDEILTDAQRQALLCLGPALQPAQAFLAGGVAMGLRFGHRRSEDLDWFTVADFDVDLMVEQAVAAGVTVHERRPGTVLGTCGGVAFSLIRWRYRADPPEAHPRCPVATLATATSMKMLALVNRGFRRDFLDLAAVLSSGLSLAQILARTEQDIPGLGAEGMLRALAYTADAEVQPAPAGTDAVDWERAKRCIAEAIADLVQPP